jgi:dynactin complex subunit
LKQSERHRLAHLFRNAHAIIKINSPFRDYVWLCQLGKEIEVGQTYDNVHESDAEELTTENAAIQTENDINFGYVDYFQ